MTTARPAFYALAPGGWRDAVTLLHPPYTLWHLSYVAIGAAIAPTFDAAILGWTALAFLLALGVAAHALDELHGRPLQTTLNDSTLVALAVAAVAGAAAIGIAIAVRDDLWLLLFVAVGCLLVAAYNLELFGGFLHGDIQFALAWGAFPVLTAYFASAHKLGAAAVAAAVAAAFLSLAQRVLSSQVRDVRRRATAVRGTLEWSDGTATALDAGALTKSAESALQLLCVAIVLLAVALVLVRVT
ncbi:MAG: hypothetical protein E6G13_06440 [Actinobacteria bacterium]|nr:MAG: hypothetical protein E6G13_06440 [Actinomycetota bacterium]